MAHDQQVAARLCRFLKGRRPFVEKKNSGGLAFL